VIRILPEQPVESYQVIEPLTGPNQQDARSVLSFVDDPLPAQAAKAIKR
jgi:hypothetical protein